MAIKLGDTLPSAEFTVVTDSGTENLSSEAIFDNKTVVLFGVPGAFTPTCSEAHLPGYIEHYPALVSAGVDTVACITVNDPFVVSAWMKAQQVKNVMMLADGNADFVSALGMDVDMTARGFGKRSARFAMIVKNGIAQYVAREEVPRDHGVTAAKAILEQLS